MSRLLFVLLFALWLTGLCGLFASCGATHGMEVGWDWQDVDGDGIRNGIDIDVDGDGVINTQDVWPLNPALW